MKIRNGFVSNSSSSSFVCDITGSSEGGYDCSMSDLGMASCKNGHTFYDDNLINIDNFRTLFDLAETSKLTLEQITEVIKDEEFAKVIFKDYEKYGYLDEDILSGYEVYSYMCPICQMQEFSRDDLIAFTLKKLGMTSKELLEEANKNFKNYKEFREYIK